MLRDAAMRRRHRPEASVRSGCPQLERSQTEADNGANRRDRRGCTPAPDARGKRSRTEKKRATSPRRFNWSRAGATAVPAAVSRSGVIPESHERRGKRELPDAYGLWRNLAAGGIVRHQTNPPLLQLVTVDREFNQALTGLVLDEIAADRPKTVRNSSTRHVRRYILSTRGS
jgi:hypothetical protein